MKLTTALIKQFEQDQKQFGTKTAMYNLLWLSATSQLQDLGVKHVKTSKK